MVGFHGDNALELGFGTVEGIRRIGQVQERQSQVETGRVQAGNAVRTDWNFSAALAYWYCSSSAAPRLNSASGLTTSVGTIGTALSVSESLPSCPRLPGAAGNRRREVRP